MTMPLRLEDLTVDAFWVMPGRLLAGEYPGDRSRARAEKKIEELISLGVTSFVDLTEAHELVGYDALLPRNAGSNAIHYRRLPIVDVDVPTVERMIEILDVLDAELADHRVVYVHCWGGVGRTGTVIGAWLVRHGLSGVDALDRIAALRQDTRKAWRAAPETEHQRAMVRTWAQHEARRRASD